MTICASENGITLNALAQIVIMKKECCRRVAILTVVIVAALAAALSVVSEVKFKLKFFIPPPPPTLEELDQELEPLVRFRFRSQRHLTTHSFDCLHVSLSGGSFP